MLFFFPSDGGPLISPPPLAGEGRVEAAFPLRPLAGEGQSQAHAFSFPIGVGPLISPPPLAGEGQGGGAILA
jgi:hypothetical protein